MESIDAFLQYHPGFLPIGKIAIAICLIPLESPERLLDTSDWYTYLYRYMGAEFDSFGSDNKLTVLTFNYD
ncbi:MAG: hypothetical protein NTW19_05985 [Planctomycetota bacterium]|nr:hypothetical protein [Planctomycetota bacterium]